MVPFMYSRYYFCWLFLCSTASHLVPVARFSQDTQFADNPLVMRQVRGSDENQRAGHSPMINRKVHSDEADLSWSHKVGPVC